MDEKIRRADLYLRAKYPHLDTRIFKLTDDFYGILLKNFTGNFNEIQQEFDYSIKPMATPVNLFEKMPSNIEKELSIIKDDEIGNNFSGLPLTLLEVKYLLMAKFPMIEIIYIEEIFDTERKLNVYTDIISDENIKKEVINLLDSLDIPLNCNLIDDKSEDINKKNIERKEKKKSSSIKDNNPLANAYFDSFENPIIHSFPTKLNKTKIIYEERDEQIWFDKLGEIYAGKFTKTDILKDVNINNSCYIDYSLFNNVNIRNGIVLYDKIFVELPISSDIKTFCSAQKINSDEIIQLCKENKLTFILPQPSYRYDFNFLNELYKINSNCILSRRALSALIICDLVEINKNYFINALGISDSMYEISEIIKQTDEKYDKIDFYNFFTWPQKALRSVLEVFLFGSTYKSVNFGINNLFTNMLDDKQKKKMKIEFEFGINSDKVHISSALNSQYLPYFEGTMYSNRIVTSIMGNMLNFYKNSSIEKIQNYMTERHKIITNNTMLPINLIEVDEYRSITELNHLSKKYFSSSNFSSILGYLLSIPPEDMGKKIIEYNNLVENEINRSKKKSDFIDLSVTSVTDAVGLVIPFFSTMTKILLGIVQKSNLSKLKIDKIKEAFYKLEQRQKYDEKKAISFLSKINSVARLIKKYE